MTLAFLFWLLMVLSLVLGSWGIYVPGQPFNFRPFAGNLLVFIPLAIIGWKLFGAAIHP